MSKYQNKSFIAISAIWYERFLECSRTDGTDEFVNSVYRYKNSLVDLGDDNLAIKKIVQDFYDKTWMPRFVKEVERVCHSENISKNDSSSITVIQKEIEKDFIVDLYMFINQTIQDSGIGWQMQDSTFSYLLSQE